MVQPSSVLSLEDVHQPFGFLVIFAGGLLQNAAVLVDVVQVLADLNEPGIFVAFEVGAVDLRAAALAVVALAVPAVEGEPDALAGLG